MRGTGGAIMDIEEGEEGEEEREVDKRGVLL